MNILLTIDPRDTTQKVKLAGIQGVYSLMLPKKRTSSGTYKQKIIQL